jgi:hypothetical protein
MSVIDCGKESKLADTSSRASLKDTSGAYLSTGSRGIEVNNCRVPSIVPAAFCKELIPV